MKLSPKTIAARDAALGFIDAANAMLLKAASVSCDLQGWADQWRDIGDHADTVKALWHRCNDAPMPTGHDYEPTDSLEP